ncbi:MAG TPA: alkaline shock response membrane anchor protein AmaP [Candidatus Omnitrophota bacterium]|nr:alkaline shock response membrane anchor protein AmaP [Candidatus Omnitrophota bacterium]HPB67498.1 alkaline shock response membrane anchor protein AmaP [Candidatus Omnitrophota bacterium]HQO57513.1 alkaline shock response membrane anchor protein AmaP [Candidatus Omnitrophota bacterium]HQP12366.1 alkaline shock response membrane anchor protein AmaP [Candidatus Omnitrophota bacterium]
MKIVARFGVLFYGVLTMFVGVVLILFVTHYQGYALLPLKDVVAYLEAIHFDTDKRVFVAGAGLLILWVNYIFVKAMSDERQREKTIAFDNPTGRVSVSLDALEDLTRRVIAGVEEVREVRSSIRVGKRGLEINARLILNTDVNIPEMTAHLQDLVKRKVQDTIGIEETPSVRIHISKIIPGQRKPKRLKEPEEAQAGSLNVPYQGYRV